MFSSKVLSSIKCGLESLCKYVRNKLTHSRIDSTTNVTFLFAENTLCFLYEWNVALLQWNYNIVPHIEWIASLFFIAKNTVCPRRYQRSPAFWLHLLSNSIMFPSMQTFLILFNILNPFHITRTVNSKWKQRFNILILIFILIIKMYTRMIHGVHSLKAVFRKVTLNTILYSTSCLSGIWTFNISIEVSI